MTKKISTVFAEGILVGILLIIFIHLSSYLLRISGYPMVATPEECKKWNDTYIMEVTALLAGFLFHVSCEYIGVNEYYVMNYYK